MKARTSVDNVRISTKDAVIVGRRLRGKYVSKARGFLESMVSEKENLNGKHYTKTCQELLTVLNTAEKNAVNRDMDEERLVIATVNCSPGTRISRQRWRGAGSRMKMTNVVFVLTQARKALGGKTEKKTTKPKKELDQDYDDSIAGKPKAEKKEVKEKPKDKTAQKEAKK